MCVADFDGDHKPDIGAVIFQQREMCFENDGTNHFIPRVLAHSPTHLIVVKAADMFNDGRVELVTGAFMFYPPYDRISRVTLWEPKH